MSGSPRPIVVEIAPGELIDKITILQIKATRIKEADKKAHVEAELGLLEKVRAEAVAASAQLAKLSAQLLQINERLWEIEDAIRVCEGWGDFGPDFVELARSVYRTNDLRADLKRQINLLLGSALVEEKSYADY
ncbi:MAG: hypothetical protein GKR89_22100 [Candidatus Latescibacteria bacterium]|nr:hypothetical protein [Candidatus Latescibacterota bacterium]